MILRLYLGAAEDEKKVKDFTIDYKVGMVKELMQKMMIKWIWRYIKNMGVMKINGYVIGDK